MFGGIPTCELDELAKCWDVFGGLRDALFSVSGNYAAVKVEDVGAAIAAVESVKEYAAAFEKALDGFDGYLKRELVEHCRDVHVNAEEGRLAGEVFRRVESLSLIDKYEAYQALDDEWMQTAIDLEIIQTDGFDSVRVVDPHMVLKKTDDKTIEVQDGWVGRIFPFELVQKMFFADELGEIAEKIHKIDKLVSDVVSLASEMPEEGKERVVKEGEDELDAKLVNEVAKEVFDDIETDEVNVLKQYLELRTAVEKKAFIEQHPGVEWSSMSAAKNGIYNNKTVLIRIHVIHETFEFPEDSFEAMVLAANRLFARIKSLKSTLRILEKALEKKTIEKIKSLTDEEANALLEEKWVKPVVAKLNAMPTAIVDALAAKIKALSAKYATTLSEVVEKIETSENRIAEMLGELEGTEDDMAGITAWKKELAR